MKEKLISVIIPVYKVEDYLDKCVESVVNQTYKNLEIILVDDGSPDACPEMCEEWAKKDSRIRVVHKENGGLSDARNAGLDIMTGDYVTFVDSDDYLELDACECLLNIMKEDNSDIGIGNITFVYEDGKKFTLKEKVDRFKLEGEEVFKEIFYSNAHKITTILYTTAWCKLYKASLFSDIRYPKGKLHEDEATTYKAVLKCNAISYTSKPVYNYLQRTGSIVHGKKHEKGFDHCLEIFEEKYNTLKEKLPKYNNLTMYKNLVFGLLHNKTTKERHKKAKKLYKDLLKQGAGKSLKDKLYLMCPPLFYLVRKIKNRKNTKRF